MTLQLPGAKESEKKSESQKRSEPVLPPPINPNKRNFIAPSLSPNLPPVKPFDKSMLNDIDDDQEDETEERIPEKIIDATKHKHRTYYLVKYRKVSLKHCTWNTVEQIPNGEKLVADFFESVEKERIIMGKGRFAYKRAIRRAFRVGEFQDKKVQTFDNDGKSIYLEPTMLDLSRTPLTPMSEIEADQRRRNYYNPMMNNQMNPMLPINYQNNPHYQASHFPPASVNTMQIQQHQQNLQEGGRNFQPPLNQPLLLQKRTVSANSYFVPNLQGPPQPLPQQQLLPQYYQKENSSSDRDSSEKGMKEDAKQTAQDIEIKLEAGDEKQERYGQFSLGDIPLKIKGIGKLDEGKIYIIVEWHQRQKEDCAIMPTKYSFDQFPPAGYKHLIDYLIQKIKFPEKKSQFP